MMMKVLNTVIQTKSISLKNNHLSGNFKMDPMYTKQIEKTDDKTYVLTLGFNAVNTPDKPFPIDISCHLQAIFTFDDQATELEIENFLQIPAVQIIYPHLRSLVSSITASAYLQPMLLPLVDARVFVNI
ncbi:Bacterial protein export chaperone SecB [Acholeplasma oculi]|uniref:Bacterial protein export chaperone SecB n=2 Tax=Acholeplasma oculi TaxID=35623 RepID=A0A061AK41_9MOLU|nr:Bacterial protein export chaperone SecB [Acholeplasma oculi]